MKYFTATFIFLLMLISFNVSAECESFENQNPVTLSSSSGVVCPSTTATRYSTSGILFACEANQAKIVIAAGSYIGSLSNLIPYALRGNLETSPASYRGTETSDGTGFFIRDNDFPSVMSTVFASNMLHLRYTDFRGTHEFLEIAVDPVRVSSLSCFQQYLPPSNHVSTFDVITNNYHRLHNIITFW
jgi:hypothetical protein